MQDVLATVRGFVFDLDGCVWHGAELSPGAARALAELGRAGRRLAFVSNNSRATGVELAGRLTRLGVSDAAHVLTPLDLIAGVVAERCGRARVLVIGAPELEAAIAEGGHTLVPPADWTEASAVVVGNDFDFTYERLTAAARAVAGGAVLVTPNLDPRLPIEGGRFLPGCGAIVEAVAVAAGVRPVVVGKPEPSLFRLALERLALAPPEAAMVGDSLASDIAGARAVGMRTVLFAPEGPRGRRADGPRGRRADGQDGGAADTHVASFAELARRAGVGP